MVRIEAREHMHITSKGQVTIPQHIREKFGLLPNSEVEFKVEKNRVYLIKSNHVTKRSSILLQKMTGRGDVKMSTDEIMALTRK